MEKGSIFDDALDDKEYEGNLIYLLKSGSEFTVSYTHLKMISDILKDAGFETVLTAMSVKKAILTAKEETPDLIVLDRRV